MLLFEEQPEKTNRKIISNAKKQTIRIFLFFIVVISFLNICKYSLLYFLTKINMCFFNEKPPKFGGWWLLILFPLDC